MTHAVPHVRQYDRSDASGECKKTMHEQRTCFWWTAVPLGQKALKQLHVACILAQPANVQPAEQYW